MINIIGPTEQEARQIYTEAERTLNEKNAEIDRENEKRKKVNAKIEPFKKWEDKLYNIGGVLIVVGLIFLVISICTFLLECSKSFALVSLIMLVIGSLLCLGALILKSYIKMKYGTIDLRDMLYYYSIDDYLPVAYDYYELCQKYGQPINTKWDDYYWQIDLVFADADNTIVEKHLGLEGFEYVEKYKLSEVTIDLINKTIHVPYELT